MQAAFVIHASGSFGNPGVCAEAAVGLILAGSEPDAAAAADARCRVYRRIDSIPRFNPKHAAALRALLETVRERIAGCASPAAAIQAILPEVVALHERQAATKVRSESVVKGQSRASRGRPNDGVFGSGALPPSAGLVPGDEGAPEETPRGGPGPHGGQEGPGGRPERDSAAPRPGRPRPLPEGRRLQAQQGEEQEEVDGAARSGL